MSFENHLKETLREKRSDVDAEKIWRNVEPRLNEKRKKRGFIFWLWGTGGAIILTALLWAISYNFQNTSTPSSELTTNPMINETTNKDELQPQSYQEKEDTSLVTNTTKEFKKASYSPPSGSHLATRKSSIQSKLLTKSYIETKTTQSPNSKRSNTTEGRKSLANFRNQKDETKAATIKNSRRTLLELNLLQWAKLTPLSFQREKKTLLLNKVIEKKKAQVNATSKWNLVLLGGIGLTNKASLSHDFRYEFYRNTYEEALENLSFGLLFERKLNHWFSITSGLAYHVQNERFEWKGEYLEQNNGEHIEAIYWPSPTQSLQITSFGNYETKASRDMLKYNHYHIVSVPLYLGFTLGKNKWKTSLHPGLKMDVLRLTESDQLNSQGNPVRILNTKSSLRLVPATYLSSSYQLSHKMDLTGGIHFDRRSFSETDKIQKVDHSYKNLQFKIGIRLNL